MSEQPTIEQLIQDLQHSDTFVRSNAARALGESGDPRAVDALIQELTSSNWKSRRNAANALGLAKDKRAVEPLIQTLSDDTPTVRSRAVVALGNLRDERALLPLIECMLTTFADGLVTAIAKFGRRAVEPIVELLERQPDLDINRLGLCLEILAKIKDQRVVGPLLRLLSRLDRNSHEMIIGLTVRALEHYKDPAISDKFVEILQERTVSSRGLWYIEQALASRRDSRTLRQLLPLIEGQSLEKVSISTMRRIFELGGISPSCRSLADLARFSRDEQIERRAAACVALPFLRSPAVIPPLFERWLFDVDERVRRAAGWAIAAVEPLLAEEYSSIRRKGGARDPIIQLGRATGVWPFAEGEPLMRIESIELPGPVPLPEPRVLQGGEQLLAATGPDDAQRLEALLSDVQPDRRAVERTLAAWEDQHGRREVAEQRYLDLLLTAQSDQERVELSCALAELAGRWREGPLMEQHLTTAWTYLQHCPSPALSARLHQLTCGLLLLQGKFQQGCAAARKALALRSEAERAPALIRLSQCLYHQGHYHALFESLIPLLCGAPQQHPSGLWAQALLVYGAGLAQTNPVAAESFVQQALALHGQRHDPLGICEATIGLAHIYIQQERYNAAEELLQDLAGKFKLQRLADYGYHVFNQLGTILCLQNKVEEALVAYQQSLTGVGPSTPLEAQAGTWHAIGSLQLKQGNVVEAAAWQLCGIMVFDRATTKQARRRWRRLRDAVKTTRPTPESLTSRFEELTAQLGLSHERGQILLGELLRELA